MGLIDGLMGKKPATSTAGAGAAKQGAQTLDLRNEYGEHVRESTESGEKPQPYAEWIKTKGYELRPGSNLPTRTR